MTSTREWLQAIGAGVVVSGTLASASVLASARLPTRRRRAEIVSAIGCVQQATAAEAGAGGQHTDGTFVLRGAGRLEQPAHGTSGHSADVAGHPGQQRRIGSDEYGRARQWGAASRGSRQRQRDGIAAAARWRAAPDRRSRCRSGGTRRPSRDGDRPALVLRGAGWGRVDVVGPGDDRDEGGLRGAGLHAGIVTRRGTG